MPIQNDKVERICHTVRDERLDRSTFNLIEQANLNYKIDVAYHNEGTQAVMGNILLKMILEVV